jgi:hypothetical protein
MPIRKTNKKKYIRGQSKRRHSTKARKRITRRQRTRRRRTRRRRTRRRLTNRRISKNKNKKYGGGLFNRTLPKCSSRYPDGGDTYLCVCEDSQLYFHSPEKSTKLDLKNFPTYLPLLLLKMGLDKTSSMMGEQKIQITEKAKTEETITNALKKYLITVYLYNNSLAPGVSDFTISENEISFTVEKLDPIPLLKIKINTDKLYDKIPPGYIPPGYIKQGGDGQEGGVWGRQPFIWPPSGHTGVDATEITRIINEFLTVTLPKLKDMGIILTDTKLDYLMYLRRAEKIIYIDIDAMLFKKDILKQILKEGLNIILNKDNFTQARVKPEAITKIHTLYGAEDSEGIAEKMVNILYPANENLQQKTEVAETAWKQEMTMYYKYFNIGTAGGAEWTKLKNFVVTTSPYGTILNNIETYMNEIILKMLNKKKRWSFF